jgi:hypothetical protein
MLLACFSSIVFLVIQRRLLRGSLVGGTSLGTALARIGSGGPVAGAAGDGGGGGWARPVDAGLHGALRVSTFAGAREDWAARRQIQRRMRNEGLVRDANPELVEHEVFRAAEAQRVYEAGGAAVQAWRRRSRRLRSPD